MERGSVCSSSSGTEGQTLSSGAGIGDRDSGTDCANGGSNSSTERGLTPHRGTTAGADGICPGSLISSSGSFRAAALVAAEANGAAGPGGGAHEVEVDHHDHDHDRKHIHDHNHNCDHHNDHGDDENVVTEGEEGDVEEVRMLLSGGGMGSNNTTAQHNNSSSRSGDSSSSSYSNAGDGVGGGQSEVELRVIFGIGNSSSSREDRGGSGEPADIICDISPTDRPADNFDGGCGGKAECRICQEEEDVGELEVPCACSGSLKYAHRGCVQKWCVEKGDTTCEICHKPYKGGYAAEPRSGVTSTSPSSSGVVTIEIVEAEGPGGSTSRVLRLRNSVTGEETHFELTEDDRHREPSRCCKAGVILVLLLLFIAHILEAMADATGEDALSLLVLRVVGILLPCWICAPVILNLPCSFAHHYLNDLPEDGDNDEVERDRVLEAAAFL